MAIHELAALEKLGDYCFKVEFSSLEEKIRVFEEGGGDLGGTRAMHCYWCTMMSLLDRQR
jgi:hypothetical protein